MLNFFRIPVHIPQDKEGTVWHVFDYNSRQPVQARMTLVTREDESRNMDVFEDDESVMDISDIIKEIYYYSVDNQKA